MTLFDNYFIVSVNAVIPAVAARRAQESQPIHAVIPEGRNRESHPFCRLFFCC